MGIVKNTVINKAVELKLEVSKMQNISSISGAGDHIFPV